MMKDFETVSLDIDFGETFTVPLLRGPSEDVEMVQRRGIQLTMNRKRTQLGNIGVDQWWIPLQGLYADRNRASSNYREILNCFWGWCQHAGSIVDDRHVQESFILASLLPEARSNGARNVFLDAYVTSPTKKAKQARYAFLPALDSMLKKSKQETLESTDFIERTGDILGPPEYNDEAKECYATMSHEIFDDACAALAVGDAVGLRFAFLDWRNKMRTISRRGGKKLEKQVLDILSYECRTAFHRAYSATWTVIFEAIRQRYGMTEEELLFHRLWHLDHSLISSEMPDVSCHLFHGHIFALHPAFGDFISTETGGEIIGDFISDPSQHNYQRTIHGLLIAAYHYHQLHEDMSRNRKPKQKNVNDSESTHATTSSKGVGKRLDRTSKED